MTNQQSIDKLLSLLLWLDKDSELYQSIVMAISALKAQEAKAQLSAEGTTSDLIRRQAAIEALDCINGVEEVLRALPPAQPEPCEDAVSREAAIDVAENAFVRGLLASPDIRRLPPAQPEIIRCKDCKHHRRDNTGCYYCVRKEYGYGWGLNDFCSDAERRTE